MARISKWFVEDAVPKGRRLSFGLAREHRRDLTLTTVFSNDFNDWMKAQFLASATELLDEVRDFLYTEEAINALPLGLLEQSAMNHVSADAENLFLLIKKAVNEPAGVALKTGKPVVALSVMPDLSAIDALVDLLVRSNVTCESVVGPEGEVGRFVDLWQRKKVVRAKIAMEQLIYRLDQVTRPNGVSGVMRLARVDEQELVDGWLAAFEAEATPKASEPKKRSEFVRFNLAKKAVALWSVDSIPHGMALISRETRRGASIAGVYTPPELRGRGVASALVADLSQSALDRGKEFCVLYTDLANPASNSIYQKVGYRPIQRSQHWVFEPR